MGTDKGQASKDFKMLSIKCNLPKINPNIIEGCPVHPGQSLTFQPSKMYKQADGWLLTMVDLTFIGIELWALKTNNLIRQIINNE